MFFPLRARRREPPIRENARLPRAADARILQEDQSTVDHFFRLDNLVEFLRREEAEFNACLLEGLPAVMRVFCDFRGVVVSDCRAERGYEHE